MTRQGHKDAPAYENDPKWLKSKLAQNAATILDFFAVLNDAETPGFFSLTSQPGKIQKILDSVFNQSLR